MSDTDTDDNLEAFRLAKETTWNRRRSRSIDSFSSQNSSSFLLNSEENATNPTTSSRFQQVLPLSHFYTYLTWLLLSLFICKKRLLNVSTKTKWAFYWQQTLSLLHITPSPPLSREPTTYNLSFHLQLSLVSVIVLLLSLFVVSSGNKTLYILPSCELFFLSSFFGPPFCSRFLYLTTLQMTFFKEKDFFWK